VLGPPPPPQAWVRAGDPARRLYVAIAAARTLATRRQYLKAVRAYHEAEALLPETLEFRRRLPQTIRDARHGRKLREKREVFKLPPRADWHRKAEEKAHEMLRRHPHWSQSAVARFIVGDAGDPLPLRYIKLSDESKPVGVQTVRLYLGTLSL